MNWVKVSLAGAMSLALASCSGSSPAPTPSPTPTPTPTPTGTPTPTPTPTPVTFTTIESALQYTLEGGIQRVANVNGIAPALGTVFRFTPEQNGYTYALLNGTVTPSAQENAVFPVTSAKACERTTLCFGQGFAHQQVDVAGSSYYLTRFIPGSAVVLNLTFASFGIFEESAVVGSQRQVDLRPFAYGIAATDVGTTGPFAFSGPVVGQATGNKPAGLTTASNLYEITGGFQLNGNFGSADATLKLTLVGKPVGCTTCPANLSQTYDATGTFASNVATFTLPGGGSARFFLAGPLGIETGGSFMLRAADPNEAAVTMVMAGSAAGRR